MSAVIASTGVLEEDLDFEAVVVERRGVLRKRI